MGKRREQLNEFYAGMKRVNMQNPEHITGFNALLQSSVNDGELTHREKELISVALACYSRCEYCIVYHVYSAMKAGATPKQVLDAGMVSVLFGGGPAMAYIVTALKESLDEFKEDFI
jgi:AhpD family alkylhydroperoxidase